MKRTFNMIEAPVCAGSPTKGSENAYAALKNAGITAVLGDDAVFTDYGVRPTDTPYYPDNMKHVGMVVEVSERIRGCVSEAVRSGEIPLVVGGDHSVAMGTIAGVSEVYGEDSIAVVYIDGHADINTESSTETGYIHGMPLASSLGLCSDELKIGVGKVKVRGENIHIIGARSIDDGEYPIIKANSVDLVTADECRRAGVTAIADALLQKLAGKKVLVSFDVDSMDETEFASTGYLMPDGLTFAFVRELIKRVISESDTVSFECVEYNPTLDKAGDDLGKLKLIYSDVADAFGSQDKG